MARIPVLTKEQIIHSALAITNQTGFESISIRAIAKSLGTSTAPIYTQYPNIELLYDDLSNYVYNQLIESTKKQRTPDLFLNIGVGIIAFVLENKGAYAHYFLTPNQLHLPLEDQGNPFLEQMKTHPYLSILGEERLASLLNDMSIYTYGLSTVICVGEEDDKDLDYYLSKLEQSGNKLISYHLFSSGLYETYVHNIMAKIGQHIDLKEVLKS